MKTKEVKALLKIVMVPEAHEMIDRARNARELEVSLRAWVASGAFAIAAQFAVAKREPLTFSAAMPTVPQASSQATAGTFKLYINDISAELKGMIDAVKLIRILTNTTLKDAKDAVDSVRAGKQFYVGRFDESKRTSIKKQLDEAGITWEMRA